MSLVILPKRIREVVEAFLTENPKLADPSGASGECVNMACDLERQLDGLGQTAVFDMFWRSDGSYSGPSLPHDWYEGGCEYGGHTVLALKTRKGTFVIDVTARQFPRGIEIPHPLVWKTSARDIPPGEWVG